MKTKIRLFCGVILFTLLATPVSADWRIEQSNPITYTFVFAP